MIAARADVTSWVVLRAAGIGAYVMLFLSVAYGLAATTSPFGRRVAKPSSTSFHQAVSGVGFALIGIHLLGLLADRYIDFDLLDLLVPLRAEYRPVAVAFGVLALHAMAFVAVTSAIRAHIGTALWRGAHLLSVPAFTFALVHGLFAGTDTVRPWAWWMYVLTGSTVLFLLVARALKAGGRSARRAPEPRPAAAPVAD